MVTGRKNIVKDQIDIGRTYHLQPLSLRTGGTEQLRERFRIFILRCPAALNLRKQFPARAPDRGGICACPSRKAPALKERVLQRPVRTHGSGKKNGTNTAPLSVRERGQRLHLPLMHSLKMLLRLLIQCAFYDTLFPVLPSQDHGLDPVFFRTVRTDPGIENLAASACVPRPLRPGLDQERIHESFHHTFRAQGFSHFLLREQLHPVRIEVPGVFPEALRAERPAGKDLVRKLIVRIRIVELPEGKAAPVKQRLPLSS